MKLENLTKQQLIDELTVLRDRVSQLEVLERDVKHDQQSYTERIGRYFPQANHPNEAIYVIFDRKYEFVNDQFAKIFNISPEEACDVGFDPMMLVAPDSRSLVREKHRKGIQGNFSFQQYEFTGLTKDGASVECETFVLFIPYRWGVAIHGMLRDVTSQKRIIEELQRNRSDIQIVLDSIPTSIFYMDKMHRFIRANKAFCKLLGLPYEHIIAKSLSEIFPNLPPEQLSNFIDTNDQVMHSGNSKRGFIEVFPSVRARRWIQNDRIPYRDDEGKIIGIICLAIDVSDLRETEEKLWYMSLHDVLTGLYNRTYFQEELNRLEKSRQFPVTIITVRVDDLVAVNNRDGIVSGNDLLKLTARVMKIFRTEDVVARIGGDKFAAVMPSTDKSIGEKAIQRLSTTLHAQNKQKKGRPLALSVGLATGEKNDSLFDVLKLAETDIRKIS